MNEQIQQLQAQLSQCISRIEHLERLLTYPSDDSLRTALGVPYSRGEGGSDLTDSIFIGVGGGSANVPKAYAGTFLLEVDSVTREIPFL